MTRRCCCAVAAAAAAAATAAAAAAATTAVVERVGNPVAAHCFVIPRKCGAIAPCRRNYTALLRLPVCVRFDFLGRQESWNP